MEGLEQMSREITGRAKREAQEILAHAQQEAQALVETAKRENEERLRSERARLEREAAEASERAASARALAGKRELLRVKQEIISELIGKAARRLGSQEPGAYFETLLRLLPGAVHPKETGEMVLSAADLARMPEDFAERVSQLAREKGGSVTVQREAGPAMHGFLLVYGGVEENCTFEALVQDRQNQLQDLVNELLWRERDGQ